MFGIFSQPTKIALMIHQWVTTHSLGTAVNTRATHKLGLHRAPVAAKQASYIKFQTKIVFFTSAFTILASCHPYGMISLLTVFKTRKKIETLTKYKSRFVIRFL